MPNDALIAPVLIPTGSLHFASISQDATARDLIDSLTQSAEVTEDVLGGLQDHGWDLQKVRKEQSGRPWEESELEALGDGKRSGLYH